MQNKFIHLLFIVTFTLVAQYSSYSQSTTVQTDINDDWIRLQSNDGEFSIEVPSLHRFLYNPEGFQVSMNSNDFWLRNMYMLNSFHQGTLISFEVYDGGKAAMQALYENDALAKEGRKVTEFKNGDTRIKQVINRTDKYFSIRQFFSTKNHVFVLTTASRDGEVPAMRRFLDSLIIAADKNAPNVPNAKYFSAMKTTDVALDFNLDTDKKPAKPTTPITTPPPDPTIKPLVVVRAARASYVDGARAMNVKGSVRLRLKLAEDGFIPDVSVTRSLPEGLLRQALFAAIRTKFLPKEKDGKPIAVIQTIDYSFSLY